MRTPLRPFIVAAALALLSAPAFAADESYPIKLFQAEKPGTLESVHFIIQKRVDTTMTIQGSDPTKKLDLLQVDLTGKTETLQVDDAGEATSVVFYIKKMDSPDGNDLATPGTVVEMTRTSTDSEFKIRPGGSLTDDGNSVFKLLFPKTGHAGDMDRVFASATPRKIGDRWNGDAPAAAKMLSVDGIEVAAQNVHAQATVKGLETLRGTKALRLVTTMSANHVAMPQLPVPLDTCELKMTQTLLQPVDMTQPPLEIASTMDMTMRLNNPATMMAIETKMHLVINFGGMVLDKPAQKTATANEKP